MQKPLGRNEFDCYRKRVKTIGLYQIKKLLHSKPSKNEKETYQMGQNTVNHIPYKGLMSKVFIRNSYNLIAKQTNKTQKNKNQNQAI